jgi:hypothetical protein
MQNSITIALYNNEIDEWKSNLWLGSSSAWWKFPRDDPLNFWVKPSMNFSLFKRVITIEEKGMWNFYHLFFIYEKNKEFEKTLDLFYFFTKNKKRNDNWRFLWWFWIPEDVVRQRNEDVSVLYDKGVELSWVWFDECNWIQEFTLRWVCVFLSLSCNWKETIIWRWLT